MPDDVNGGERYSVEAPDGKAYGPVGLDVLRQWVAEGRIFPNSVLIAESSGARSEAGSIPDLFPTASPASGSGVPPPPRPMSAPSSAPYAPAAKSKFPAWAIVVIVLALCVCCIPIPAAILFPVFAQARYAAKRTAALSSMKQLGLGVAMYANDYDERLPLDMSSANALEHVLDPYVKSPALFKSLNPNGGEILGNTQLSGKSTNIVDAGRVVLLYDGKPWPEGETFAAFADFHAQRRPFTEIQSMLAVPPTFEKGN